MNDVVNFLSQNQLLVWLWRLAVWGAAAYLVILGILIFVRPSAVMRFFDGFASSSRINFLEAAVRLIVGVGFIGISPETRFPAVFFWAGAALAITAIPLMFLYELHNRQRGWVILLV